MYRFSPEALLQVFEAYLKRRMHMPRFANACSVRNALDRARLLQANRLFAKGGRISKTDLMTIEAEDILASRVFNEEMLDEGQQSWRSLAHELALSRPIMPYTDTYVFPLTTWDSLAKVCFGPIQQAKKQREAC
jgi:hypothetical protein